MKYFEVANSPFLYLLVALGIAYIIILALVFLIKAWNRCIQLGISKEKMFNVAKSSAVFTIVPSVSIIIGLFSLSTVMGVPWPWYRLSVVGSVNYELMAAEMVSDGMGFKSLQDMATNADYRSFGAVMFVMSICILTGIIVNIFAAKKIQTGMTSYKKKKGDWGVIMTGCFFLAMIAAFTPTMFASGTVYALVFIVSIITTLVQYVIVKKFNVKWLQSFIMSISLIVGMASSVIFTAILK
ncbi:MAG: DUF5058 family protein [Oscillospiraceae bacterium]